jgi:hypothetical protein
MGWSGLLLISYLATLKINPLPRIVERRVLRAAECDYCGEWIDMFGIWSCGCGYISWQPRHGLSRCPGCGKEYVWLQCPRCESSIET